MQKCLLHRLGQKKQKKVTLLLEAVVHGVAIFEVMSHFIFFLVLSRSFRAAVINALPFPLPNCCRFKVNPTPNLDAHTLHTVQDQRHLPRKAAKNLVVEEIP